MAMSRGGSGASSPQMNVTPLIDVLLVLIIIFMIIVAQSKEKGFKTEIPQPPAGPDSAPGRQVRTVVIQLGEAKKGDVPVLRINQQAVTWPDLKTQLSDIFKTRAEKVAFVQGDDEVNFEYVA
jgi:biopolymer transport protein TolR